MTSKLIIKIVALSLLLCFAYSCDDDRVCSLDQSSMHILKCWGKCPSASATCYLRWRAKGSSDPWETENKDHRDRDAARDAELQYACACQ